MLRPTLPVKTLNFFVAALAACLLALPSASQARGVSETLCKSVLKNMNLKEYPKKKKTFTQLAPTCVADDGKNYFINQIMLVNKGDSFNRSTVDGMVKAITLPVTEAVCKQPETVELLGAMDYKINFTIEGESNVIHSILITEARCKEVASERAKASSVDIASCNTIADINRKILPKKLSDETTRIDVKCRKGFTKPAALVVYEELTINQSPAQARSIIQQQQVRDVAIKGNCGSASFRATLNAMDVVIVYVVKGEEVGEIEISKDTCDQL